MSATYRFPPAHLIPEDDGGIDQHTSTESGGDSSNANAQDRSQQPQLALPSTDSVEATKELNVSGSDDVRHTLRFDDLGPMVINKDGTLSRIHNWAQMTDAERERTVRVLGKRNMLRKEAILKDNQASG